MDTLITKTENRTDMLGRCNLIGLSWSYHAQDKAQQLGVKLDVICGDVVERQTYCRRTYVDERILVRMTDNVYVCVSLTDRRIVTVYRDDFRWKEGKHV